MNFKDKRYYINKTKEILGICVSSIVFIFLVMLMFVMA